MPHIFKKKNLQNKQKLKKFLNYNKKTKTQYLKKSKAIINKAAIYAIIKPKDVYLVKAI